MARPGLTKHRKFLRLAAAVGGPAIARGCLELMWDSAYECGEAIIGDEVDVEIVAGWPGERGVFHKAVMTCGGNGPGFVEVVPGRPGAYQVHDLFHHAPDYVRKRRTREADRRSASGRCPDVDQSVTSQGPDSVRSEGDNGRTPAPAPAPAPIEPPSAPSEPFPPSKGGTTATDTAGHLVDETGFPIEDLAQPIVYPPGIDRRPPPAPEGAGAAVLYPTWQRNPGSIWCLFCVEQDLDHKRRHGFGDVLCARHRDEYPTWHWGKPVPERSTHGDQAAKVAGSGAEGSPGSGLGLPAQG